MASGSDTPLIDTRAGEKQRLVTAIESFLRHHMLSDDNAMPAEVLSYDRVKNVAQVKPLIKIVTTQKTTISRNSLANIPVVSIGGGGFNVNFPLKKGDLGWIFATDRDMSTFLETLQESPPNSTRIHDFGDSLFLPDVLRQYTINSEDVSNNAMVIQTTDAATRIAIWEGNIQITAPTQVTVSSPQTNFTGNVTIEQSLTVQQNITVDGNATIDGNATVDGTLTVDGTNVNNHGHISSSPGNRTSGGMIP